MLLITASFGIISLIIFSASFGSINTDGSLRIMTFFFTISAMSLIDLGFSYIIFAFFTYIDMSGPSNSAFTNPTSSGIRLFIISNGFSVSLLRAAFSSIKIPPTYNS